MSLQLSTSRFGEVTVCEEDIIHFPDGIPGFERQQRWVLIGDEGGVILWLQSVIEGGLALPLGLAQLLHPGYNAHITQEQLADLQPVSADDLATFLVVSIPPDEPWEMTANLRAPIVVNRATRVGVQVLAANEEYGFSHSIISENSRKGMREQAASAAKAEA